MYLYDIAEEIEIQIKWRKQLRCCTRCVRPGEIAFFLFVHCFFSVFFYDVDATRSYVRLANDMH